MKWIFFNYFWMFHRDPIDSEMFINLEQRSLEVTLRSWRKETFSISGIKRRAIDMLEIHIGPTIPRRHHDFHFHPLFLSHIPTWIRIHWGFQGRNPINTSNQESAHGNSNQNQPVNSSPILSTTKEGTWIAIDNICCSPMKSENYSKFLSYNFSRENENSENF